MQMKESFDSSELIFFLLAINLTTSVCVYSKLRSLLWSQITASFSQLAPRLFFNTNLFWLRADLAGWRTRQRSLPQVLRYIWCLFVSKCARGPLPATRPWLNAPRQPRVYGNIFYKNKVLHATPLQSPESKLWATFLDDVTSLPGTSHSPERASVPLFLLLQISSAMLWVTLSVFCW